ncbi:MAG: hypothetical protein F4X94_06755 [Dehalococcoidia bacterium]|nr:hypothetical protein [Dehalococcoidia bacterium]
MSLTQELKDKHADLWQRMVFHPFIVEMGDGTLSHERARRYFLQDYVFVNDLVAMIAHGTAKAPSVEAASHLYAFLSVILSPESADENDFFMRAFDILGATEEDYSSATASPTTQGFGDFLVRTGLGGSFEEVVAVCYVTEGTYLDWGTRFLNEGKSPSNPIYREWIELHGPDYLGDFVAWCESVVDNADDGGERRARIERVFHTALRYEYLFWEAAYNGDKWPDD